MTLKPEHTLAEEICAALRAWRIRSRLRQDAIAKCLGVAQSQISRWESGRDLPRPHNVEAIRRLIRGPEADPLLALKHFVLHSSQHLLLLDDHFDIVARSLPFQGPASSLEHFGWVIDAQRNPAFAPARRRYHDLLADPGSVVGMTITLPFRHQGTDWVAHIGNTIHSIAGTRVCLCELSFVPAATADGGLRIEEVRLDAAGETRHATTVWRPQLAQ